MPRTVIILLRSMFSDFDLRPSSLRLLVLWSVGRRAATCLPWGYLRFVSLGCLFLL